MILRNLTLTGGLALLAPGVAVAQRAAAGPSASVLFRPAVPAAGTDSVRLPRTYWQEGALISGIPSAIVGGALGIGVCEFADGSGEKNCLPGMIGGALFFGLIGAIPGALIGGQFEKP